MKSEATVIWVNEKALEFDNGHKCFETKFCDEDGIVGTVYIMDKKPVKGQGIKVRLDYDGDKIKFKLDK